MRDRVVLGAGLAALALCLAGPAGAADVGATALRRMCADQGEPMASIGCEAYVDGFLSALALTGAACPTAGAARALRRDLLAAAPDALGSQPASDYLLGAARKAYPCSPLKGSR